MAENVAILISYDTKRERFDSLYERNKFYRGLFGYKQKVKENGKVYRYEKKGLIDRIPHIKVEDSVIIVAKRSEELFKQYFAQWTGKVEYKTYKIILDSSDWDKIHPSEQS